MVRTVEAKDYVMTVDDFLGAVNSGCFIDYDGHACPSYLGMVEPDIRILPSQVKGHGMPKFDIDPTHIVWFRRRH